MHVVDYRVDHVPVRFVCELQDGTDDAAESVPDHVNPAVLGCGLAAAVCAGAAALESERHARTPP